MELDRPLLELERPALRDRPRRAILAFFAELFMALEMLLSLDFTLAFALDMAAPLLLFVVRPVLGPGEVDRGRLMILLLYCNIAF